MNKEIINLTNPMQEEELEAVLGGGDGVLTTLTHECNVNSWVVTEWFTCCD